MSNGGWTRRVRRAWYSYWGVWVVSIFIAALSAGIEQYLDGWDWVKFWSLLIRNGLLAATLAVITTWFASRRAAQETAEKEVQLLRDLRSHMEISVIGKRAPESSVITLIDTAIGGHTYVKDELEAASKVMAAFAELHSKKDIDSTDPCYGIWVAENDQKLWTASNAASAFDFDGMRRRRALGISSLAATLPGVEYGGSALVTIRASRLRATALNYAAEQHRTDHAIRTAFFGDFGSPESAATRFRVETVQILVSMMAMAVEPPTLLLLHIDALRERDNDPSVGELRSLGARTTRIFEQAASETRALIDVLQAMRSLAEQAEVRP